MNNRGIRFLVYSCFVFILMLYYACSLARTVYKSQDAEGNVIFSDTPQTMSAEPIEVDDLPALPSSSANTKQASQTMDTSQSESSADQSPPSPPPDPAWEERVKKACEGYRKNLSTLQETGRRVYSMDAQGKAHYLSDEERQQKIESVQKNIKEYCQ